MCGEIIFRAGELRAIRDNVRDGVYENTSSFTSRRQIDYARLSLSQSSARVKRPVRLSAISDNVREGVYLHDPASSHESVKLTRTH